MDGASVEFDVKLWFTSVEFDESASHVYVDGTSVEFEVKLTFTSVV